MLTAEDLPCPIVISAMSVGTMMAQLVLSVVRTCIDLRMPKPKSLEIRLAKVYKSSLENEKKLQTYLYERYFSSTQRPGERPRSIR